MTGLIPPKFAEYSATEDILWKEQRRCIIGEVTARRFAAEGARVAIAELDDSEGQRVAREINSRYGPQSALAVKVDVSSDLRVCSLVQEVIERLGVIDVVFNNAATILPKALEDVTEQEWTRVVDVKLKSVYLLTKYTISHLRQTSGCIVNMAS